MGAAIRAAVPIAAAPLAIALLLAVAGCDTGDSRLMAFVRELAPGPGETATPDPAAPADAQGPEAALLIESAEVSSYPETGSEPEGETLYGYVDAGGSMRMVRGLEQVPPEYRDRARNLSAVASFNQVDIPAPGAVARARSDVRPEFNPNRFDAVLYSSESCGYCARTRSLLDSLGVSYELRDIHRTPGAREEVRSVLGRVSVPLLGVDGAWVSGYKPDAIKRVLGLDG